MSNADKPDPEVVYPKSFEDLILEVHQKGICGQCGGCVSFCSAGDLKAIQIPEDGPPIYIHQDKCIHCGICYLICPQVHVLDSEIKTTFNWKFPIGNWTHCASAQAKSKEIKDVATDGGVVTAILMYLLEKKLINGAIVTKKAGLFGRESFFATTKKDLLEAAGSKYDLPTQILDYGKYSTFTPVVIGLKEIMDTERMNIAVVGTPCQIFSIRKMQQLKILPAHVIKYAFGLFCYENFMFSAETWKKMENKFHFSINNLEKMNIKEDVIFYRRKGEPIHIKFSDMEEFMRPACTACNDFSNFYSDISFGGLGSKEGFTTILTRTKLGSQIYEKALNAGYIVESPEDNTSVLKSQKLAKIITFAKMKMKRAEKTLAEKS
ncbi:MAG: Coenzyme F420 hydrogenase/dehydrogenase, beta subunit C-terminal domain [Candidatus Hodarchaeota archaeon]